MWKSLWKTSNRHDHTLIFLLTLNYISLQNLRLNGGKCGTCGDPYQGPRENEAGGKYAQGVITRKYPSYKRKLPVKVVLTAYHKGYYEFKICPHNNPHTAVSQRCLDRHPLRIVEGSRRYRTRYYPHDSGVHHMTLLLPRDIKCTQCVLQWRYRTGNVMFIFCVVWGNSALSKNIKIISMTQSLKLQTISRSKRTVFNNKHEANSSY